MKRPERLWAALNDGKRCRLCAGKQRGVFTALRIGGFWPQIAGAAGIVKVSGGCPCFGGGRRISPIHHLNCVHEILSLMILHAGTSQFAQHLILLSK